MNRKLLMTVAGAVMIMCMALPPAYATADVNKVLDTNLEYGVNVGDAFVYKYVMTVGISAVEGFADISIDTYFKETIVNKTVFDNGEKANFTYDELQWDQDYEFNTDLVNDPAYWSWSTRHSQIVNNTLRSLFNESIIALPADVSLEDVMSGDTIDVLIFYIMDMDGRDGAKTRIIDESGLDDPEVVEDLYNDIDEPYGRVGYSLLVDGENSTSHLSGKMEVDVLVEVKLNEFGVIEEGYMGLSQKTILQDVETGEYITNMEMRFSVKYYLVWASEDKYMTESFTPYWNMGPSWFSENWQWFLIGIVGAAAIVFITYYFNVRANCDKLIDQKHKWICGTPKK